MGWNIYLKATHQWGAARAAEVAPVFQGALEPYAAAVSSGRGVIEAQMSVDVESVGRAVWTAERAFAAALTKAGETAMIFLCEAQVDVALDREVQRALAVERFLVSEPY